jgi:ankyrin repeat protein
MDEPTTVSPLDGPPNYFRLAEDGRWDCVLPAVVRGDLAVNAKDLHGQALVHFAAWQNNAYAMKTLKALGANMSVEGPCGWRPMHYCAMNGMPDPPGQRVEVFDLLPPQDVNCATASYDTPLYWAVATNNLTLATRMAQLPEATEDVLRSAWRRVQGLSNGEFGRSARRLQEFDVVFQKALAQRTRWSPLRAAWVGAAAASVLR